MTWTQPCCERCWIFLEGEWEGDDPSADEGVWQTLTSLRRPYALTHDSDRLERCSWCGSPTFVGIYRRADPATVPYPASDDAEAAP